MCNVENRNISRFLGNQKLSVVTTLPELLRPLYVRDSPSECHTPKDTVSHPGGLKSSPSLQCEPQVS